MTTLAYDGRYTAIDTQITRGDTKYHQCKIVDIDRDTVAFTLGDLSQAMQAVEAIREGNEPPEGDYSLVVWNRDSGLYVHQGDEDTVPVLTDTYAIGSGEQAALAGLLAGKSAAEAVRLASQVCLYTGAQVDVFDTRTGKRVKSVKKRS
ncbi:MAG: hypothetical protein Q4B94_00205 [Pseudomonadota bacterium]|nr:hypothetical protein [Pseudomonadota bacterium]